MSDRPPEDDGRSTETARERALADENCRYVLRYLLKRKTAPVDELTGVLAGRVATMEGRMVGAEEGATLGERLTDDLLPTLVAAEFVDCDDGTVRLTTSVADLEALLPDRDDAEPEDTEQ